MTGKHLLEPCKGLPHPYLMKSSGNGFSERWWGVAERGVCVEPVLLTRHDISTLIRPKDPLLTFPSIKTYEGYTSRPHEWGFFLLMLSTSEPQVNLETSRTSKCKIPKKWDFQESLLYPSSCFEKGLLPKSIPFPWELKTFLSNIVGWHDIDNSNSESANRRISTLFQGSLKIPTS